MRWEVLPLSSLFQTVVYKSRIVEACLYYRILCMCVYFRTRPDRLWGPPSLPYNGYRVFLPGVKRLGRGVDHPPPSSAEVKERIELYLYSPAGPSWPVLEWTLPLPLPSPKYIYIYIYIYIYEIHRYAPRGMYVDVCPYVATVLGVYWFVCLSSGLKMEE